MTVAPILITDGTWEDDFRAACELGLMGLDATRRIILVFPFHVLQIRTSWIRRASDTPPHEILARSLINRILSFVDLDDGEAWFVPGPQASADYNEHVVQIFGLHPSPTLSNSERTFIHPEAFA